MDTFPLVPAELPHTVLTEEIGDIGRRERAPEPNGITVPEPIPATVIGITDPQPVPPQSVPTEGSVPGAVPPVRVFSVPVS